MGVGLSLHRNATHPMGSGMPDRRCEAPRPVSEDPVTTLSDRGGFLLIVRTGRIVTAHAGNL
jgi:hypothetical protein